MVLERDADGKPLTVHASLDRGATWERVEIDNTGYNDTIAHSGLRPSPTP